MDIIKALLAKYKVGVELVKHNIGLAPSDEWGAVDEDTKLGRLNKCESNLCGAFDSLQRRCSDCGCFVDIKTKLIYDPNLSTTNGQKVKVFCPKQFW